MKPIKVALTGSRSAQGRPRDASGGIAERGWTSPGAEPASRLASIGGVVCAAWAAVTVAGLLCVASPVEAQGRVQSARPLGMASAFTANASGNGALYHNPAGVGTVFMYSVEGAYFLSPGGFNTVNASIVDSKLNPKLAAGAGYSFEFNNDDDLKFRGHDARLALASPVVPNRVILGFGGRYLSYTQDKSDLIKGFTMDAGAVIRVADGFFIGAAGNNLIDVCAGTGDSDLPCPANAAPRTVGGGFALGSSFGVLLAGDVRADFSPEDEVRMIYAAGLEVLLGQVFALRGGYQHRDLESENVMALGVGIKTQSMGFDVGYQRLFKAEEDLLSLSLQLSFF